MKNKVRLQQDHIDICKQIGILDSEVLRLVFNRRELNALVTKQRGPRHRAGSKNTLGRCCYSIRTIFVNEFGPKDGRIGEWVPMRKKGWKRYITKPWNYRTQKETLVHELVHYRFPSIQHGKRFEQRIKEILRGKTFEPKHTHLFANYSKRWTEGIDADPVIIPSIRR